MPAAQTSAAITPAEMRRRHLPPAMFLVVLLLVSISLCRHLLLPRGGSPQSQHTEDDALHWLSAIDIGGDQIVADAATMLTNASISSSPSDDNHRHRFLYLRVPYSSNGTSGRPQQRTMLRLRVPSDALPNDGSLLAGFRASLRAFLRAHRHRRHGSNNVAGVMGLNDELKSLDGPRSAQRTDGLNRGYEGQAARILLRAACCWRPPPRADYPVAATSSPISLPLDLPSRGNPDP